VSGPRPGAGTGRFSDYGPPRRVDGGLRARSTRGAIGSSWWARRFLDVLESFALGTRLTRGRTYARSGQVLDLTVAPGLVVASVQGSRPRPYPVRIELTPFTDECWSRIESTLAGQAFFSARLLAGDLPQELEAVFAQAGAPLFPSGVDELRQHCGCPDVAVPCKHLAASFYLLAEAFDADPFQLLHWRGRGRAELLARLRELRGGQPSATPPVGADAAPQPVRTPSVPPAVGAAAALTGLPVVPLADTLDRFWLPPVPLPGRPATLATDAELLLRSLGAPGGAIGGPGLVERLRPAYRAFGGGSPPAAPEPPHQSGVEQQHHPADGAGQRTTEDGHRR